MQEKGYKTLVIGKGKCYVTFRNKAGQYGVFICPIKNGEYKRGATVKVEDLGAPEMTLLFSDRSSVVSLIKALTELIWTEDEHES